MSKYVAVKTRILNVLVENEIGFLSVDEIAEKALGPFPNGQFRNLGVKQVKQNMGHSIELGAERGLIVIAKKYPTKNDDTKRFRIAGYKIADASDRDYIKDAIDSKIDRQKSYTESLDLFSSRVIENELLPYSDVKKLNQ